MMATLELDRPALARPFGASFAVGVATSGDEHPEPSNQLLVGAAERIRSRLRRNEKISLDANDHLDVRLFGRSSIGARARVHQIMQSLVDTPLPGLREGENLDVGSSWAPLTGNPEIDEDRLRTIDLRAEHSLRNRDLSLLPAHRRRRLLFRIPFVTASLILLSLLVTFAIPFGIMLVAFQGGTDLSIALYFTVIAVLVIMAGMQFAEGVAALRAPKEPPTTDLPPPRATAIIAAYLPNEAATIVRTLRAFLAQEYAGGLQVILAYNTPTDLPIEAELRQLAEDNSKLVLLRVPNSRSKATNVNAALALVKGEFVGVFDADHEPMPGAFQRAWQWIANGADVVQGHCVVRNGDESAVARLVAVEFEQIYAVNHPGRARLQGFGIFGGSNGYWRTSMLRRVRFQAAILTEDIDSSVRAIRLGANIVSDPGLLSRELAPVTLTALWRQRMRWSQGWFQVSLRHGHAAVADRTLTRRQRFGLFLLLGWREMFPWVAALMWPILAFAVVRDGHLPTPEVLLTLITVLTLVSGPIQVAFAHRLAAPEIKSHTSWWWQYGAFSLFFYAEWKNTIVRVSHLRHLFRQRAWVVTPRGNVEQVRSRPVAAGAARVG